MAARKIGRWLGEESLVEEAEPSLPETPSAVWSAAPPEIAEATKIAREREEKEKEEASKLKLKKPLDVKDITSIYNQINRESGGSGWGYSGITWYYNPKTGNLQWWASGKEPTNPDLVPLEDSFTEDKKNDGGKN